MWKKTVLFNKFIKKKTKAFALQKKRVSLNYLKTFFHPNWFLQTNLIREDMKVFWRVVSQFGGLQIQRHQLK